MSEPVHAGSFTRTLRLKVRAEAYAWLNAAAVEVNQVFNWANATSIDAADRNILIGSRCLTSVRGNESAPLRVQPSQTSHRCEAGTERVRVAA